MGKKITSHILLIGVILLHLVLVILTPELFSNTILGTESNIFYNLAIDAILIFFMFLLVSQSTNIIFLYCALYEIATFAGLTLMGEAENYQIFYALLSALIYSGVIAIAKQMLKNERSSMSIKVIFIMSMIGAVCNSFVSPGFGAPDSIFKYQAAAIMILALFLWVILKLDNKSPSINDFGAAIIMMIVLPLLKRLALFLVLGMLGIDVTEFDERMIIMYGVDLIVSVVIACMISEPLIKSYAQSNISTPIDKAFALSNRMPSFVPPSNQSKDATTLKILKQVQALQSQDMQERGAAVLALSAINDPRVTEILKDVYETSPDMFSRILAMKALEERNIKVSGSPISGPENEVTAQEPARKSNGSEELEKYVQQLLELRKGNTSTSFFLGANQPANLMNMGEEIAEKFGTRGLEFVTQKIRTELKSTHPYDGRELESAWEDIWTRQKIKEG